MPDINVNKLSEILNTKADIDLNNTGVFSTSSGGVNLVQSTPSDAKGKEVTSADFSLKQGGLELMDIVFAPLGIDESKNKRRYLNGQLIIQEQFPAFTAAVKSRMATMANAFTTEENWQAEKANSKLGQCGKFVVDDTAGTIRLPCVVNAQGLADLALIGGIKSESLPNITGKFATNRFDTWETLEQGAFYSTKDAVLIDDGSDKSLITNSLNLDASRSSSTYQDNAPVQQEAVQYPYCIQVATGVEETLPAIREYQINTPFFFGQSMYSDVAPDNASWLVSNGQYNAKTVYPDYYNWILENINKGVKGFWGQTAYAYGDANGVTYLTTSTPQVGSVCYNMSYQRSGYIEAVYSDGSVKIRDDIGNASYDNIHYYPTGNISSTSLITDYDFVINTTDQTFRLPLLNGEEDIPDYNNRESCTSGTTYTASKRGFFYGYSRLKEGNIAWVTINGVQQSRYAGAFDANGQPSNGSFYFEIGAGDTYSAVISTGAGYFAPYKGNGTLYYYVGDTIQDASLINAGAVLGQLSNKADISLNNVNSAAIDKMALVGSPSVTYTSLTLGASGSKYTAPANGWFVIKVDASGNRAWVQMECGGMVSFNQNYGNEQDVSCSLQVAKGQEMTLQYAGIIAPDNLSSWIFRFVNSRSN